MKVKELIEKLKTFDPELTVRVVDGYNDNLTEEVYATYYNFGGDGSFDEFGEKNEFILISDETPVEN